LKIVQMLFDGITDILVKEGSIELRNFGVFKVKQRKPRSARNPRTGEVVQVEAQKKVTFKAGKEFLRRLGQSVAHPSVPGDCPQSPSLPMKRRKLPTSRLGCAIELTGQDSDSSARGEVDVSSI